jgi:hypothetical protein
VFYTRFSEPVFGFVPDQVTALLAFLHAQGDIDVVCNGRSWRETFETMPSPLQYDAITAGRALSAADARAFHHLCNALDIAVAEPWTPFSQRRAARKLSAKLAPIREANVHLIPQLEAAGADTAVDDIRKFRGDCTALEHEDALTGIEILLGRIGSPIQFAQAVAELRTLPDRLERHHRELRFYAHLIDTLATNPFAAELAACPNAPNLGQGAAVQIWIDGARAAHTAYKDRYRSAHDAWWASWDDSALGWSPPHIASSRHLGLSAPLRERSEDARLATESRCRRLSDLDFQPICHCGFDGDSAPADAHIAKVTAAREQIETQLRRFFGQPEIRTRVEEWSALNTGDEAQPYLAKGAPWPDVVDLDAFDRHLAGVAIVHEVDGSALLEWLSERTWSRSELAEAWRGRASVWGDRIRFRSGDVVAGEVRDWCTRQALTYGIALPRGLTASEIDSSMVAGPGLEHLEELGLGDAAVDTVLGMLFAGRLPLPEGDAGPLASAVRDACTPDPNFGPEEFADRVARLYAAHRRLAPLGGDRWLAHLDRVAGIAMEVPSLQDVLKERRAAPWCLLDCAGLTMWPTLRDNLIDLFPGWRLSAVTFATVGEQTTTKRCYERLTDAGLDHPFAKVDVVDNLVHGRFLPFEDLCAIAVAELRADLRRRSLDPTRPLVLFADHGFRLSADARRWEHGGSSTLERVVPVIDLQPR